MWHWSQCGGWGATYPVCNGDDPVRGLGFQLLTTRGNEEPTFTTSFKPAAPALCRERAGAADTAEGWLHPQGLAVDRGNTLAGAPDPPPLGLPRKESPRI